MTDEQQLPVTPGQAYDGEPTTGPGDDGTFNYGYSGTNASRKTIELILSLID